MNGEWSAHNYTILDSLYIKPILSIKVHALVYVWTVTCVNKNYRGWFKPSCRFDNKALTHSLVSSELFTCRKLLPFLPLLVKQRLPPLSASSTYRSIGAMSKESLCGWRRSYAISILTGNDNCWWSSQVRGAAMCRPRHDFEYNIGSTETGEGGKAAGSGEYEDRYRWNLNYNIFIEGLIYMS